MSSTLPKNNVDLRPLIRYFPPHFSVRRTIYCSLPNTTTPTNQLNINVRLNNSPAKPAAAALESAKRRVLVDDPSLQSTWSHRAWLASGSTAVITSLVDCITESANLHIWLQPLVAAFTGYLLADLVTGVYHWGIDNYGDASTPIFGSQIEASQGHHKFPWTITKRQSANNLHALARAITFALLPIEFLCHYDHHPVVLGFSGTCLGCIMLSQQFHAWAHGTKSKLPAVVVALQDAGILVSRSQHAAHHQQPCNRGYCIVSGVWNQLLDEHQVFETLEMIVFFKLGVRPTSWSDPNDEWIQDLDNTH